MEIDCKDCKDTEDFDLKSLKNEEFLEEVINNVFDFISNIVSSSRESREALFSVLALTFIDHIRKRSEYQIEKYHEIFDVLCSKSVSLSKLNTDIDDSIYALFYSIAKTKIIFDKDPVEKNIIVIFDNQLNKVIEMYRASKRINFDYSITPIIRELSLFSNVFFEILNVENKIIKNLP